MKSKFKPGDIARVHNSGHIFPRPEYVKLIERAGFVQPSGTWEAVDLKSPGGMGQFEIVETALFEVVWTFTGYVDRPSGDV